MTQTPTKGQDRLEYDVVVATRNRPEALAVSICTLAGQTRRPARLIVVDASDDPVPAEAAVRRALEGRDVDLVFEHTIRPGLTRQRNLGLALVESPVVFFMDDDSLPFPDAADEIMRIYERDTDGVIAGVAAADAPSAPGQIEGGWQMLAGHRRAARLGRLRNAIERRVAFLKPAIALGRTLNDRNPRPRWLAAMEAAPVSYMTGYRMTFRTAAIRPAGFDEALEGYGLEEDVDASFTAMRSGLVVGAQRARIHHLRHPSGRGDAYGRGRMEVLHRAHVLLKHASGPQGSAALLRRCWRRHLGFTALKLALSLKGAARGEGRARLSGAWAGHVEAWSLRRAVSRHRHRAVPRIPEPLPPATGTR